MYLPSIRELIRGLDTDGCVALMPYKPEDALLSRFTPEAWSQIMPNIATEEAWRAYLASLSSVVVCLVVSSVATGRQVAFVLLSIVSSSPWVISYHGGGWADSLGEVRLYYRAMQLIFAHFKAQGIEVQTSCLKTNIRAYRLDLSLGCVLLGEDDERYYFAMPSSRDL